MHIKHLKKRLQTFLVAATVSILSCGCQQIISIDDQMEDAADIANLPRIDQNEIVEEWYEMLSLSKIKAADRHCCFIRYQHALKNMAKILRVTKYKKNDSLRYNQIINEYLTVAKSTTDISFMLNCLDTTSGNEERITNIRKTAIASMIEIGDPEVFQTLLKAYSNPAYEYPVQTVIADGLIKYLPDYKTDNVCAKIIIKSMLLKQQQSDYSQMKEIEHLTGICTNFSSLNEAINLAENDSATLALVMELNLNYWRKIIKDNLNFNERAALENIALMKKLALSNVSKKIKSTIYFTLCEVAPAEYLVVLNTTMEASPTFKNMKNMLSFYHSLRNINTYQNEKLSKLTNTKKTIEKCKKLAKEFIDQRVSTLPENQQIESYEIYTGNLPDQAHDFLCRCFISGQNAISFYKNAINASLWMISNKVYDQKKSRELENAIDKLLYSARNRKDYKQIFELVFANKTSYLNQWEEMIKAVRKADIVQKDAFIDSYISLITKISSGKNIPHNFAAVNNEVFEYILASIDAPAVLKLIPYLEQQKQQKFLLNKYFYHTFRNSRYQTSVPHVAIAGDIAYKYLKELNADKRLYGAYHKLFFKGISSKTDDLSLLCADYYFRITSGKDKASIERGKKEFAIRWQNMRPLLPAAKKN